MRTLTTLFIVLFVGLTGFGQTLVTLDGLILDRETKDPVPFANVRILDRNTGTVTLDDGTFKLQFEKEKVSDLAVLQVSALGYQTRQITLVQLYRLFERTNVLMLDSNNSTVSRALVTNDTGTDWLTGTVSAQTGPLQGAVVRVKGTYSESTTDVDGNFRIKAEPGTVLQVSQIGMIPTEVAVTGTSPMNITMEVDGQLLEEVLLKGEVEKDPFNTTYETAYGKREFNKLGFAIGQVSGDDIKPSYQTLEQLFYTLNGVQSSRGTDGELVFYFNRSVGSSVSQNTLPIIILDNIIYQQQSGQSLPAIDPQNVESVTAIPGIAASVKYGSLGSAGAIIIKTKVQAYGETGGEVTKKNSALVVGNNYNEQLPFYDNDELLPNYLAQLNGAGSFEEAKRIYATQGQFADTYGIPYYMDVADYFEQWDRNYAAQIAMSIAELGPTNARVLRALAFKLEDLGQLEDAKLVYQRIAMVQPSAAQSYRDLAYIYKETGEYTKSFGLYKQILADDTEGVDFSGLQKTAENELRQLLKLYKARVDYASVSNDLLDASWKQKVRVVLEWNDPSVEFEVQFVDPNRKFFSWKHDLFDNKERIFQEVEQGFYMEEFEIDEKDRGNWLVNIRNTGLNNGNDNTPKFLKYTLYKDYGLPTQTSEVKVINLSTYEDKVSLDTFLN